MKFLKSFYYAARGIAEAFKGRNFRIMLCIGALAISYAALFCEFGEGEWAALLLTCAGVLSAEAVNTAIEKLSDSVSHEKNELVGKAKDCAAGASLIFSVFAAAVGIKLFWGAKAFEKAAVFFSEPIRIAAAAGVLAAMILFVVLPEVLKKRKL